MKKKQVIVAALGNLQEMVSDLQALTAQLTERVTALEDGKNGKPGRNQLDEALQAKVEQVRTLMAQGTVNKADIILSVWGAKPGNSAAYRQAEQEYKTIMAHIAQS